MENINDPSIIKISEEAWFKAQEYESYGMVLNNRKNGYLKILYKFLKALKNPKRILQYIKFGDFYCGDDWNYWWMDQFDGYKVLPKSFNKALEVGSGPYTNMRLLSKIVEVKDMYFTDPLMHIYKAFRLTWLSKMFEAGKVHAMTGKAEKIEFPDATFDMVVCNNVLDHVENAEMCLNEMSRVLAPGGYFIFGQELTNAEDLKVSSWKNDVGHPIKLHEIFLDKVFANVYDSKFKRILTREQSRIPHHNYGTYIYIGKKK